MALAAVLELTTSVPAVRGMILAAAFAYSAARLPFRRAGVLSTWVDVVFVTAVIYLTGGISSNYVALAVVIALQAGLFLGMKLGIFAGLLIAAGAAPDVVFALIGEETPPRILISWFTLFPMAALAGGFGARVWGSEDRKGSDVLAEANRVLSTLYRIARAMPGALEMGSVASATLSEVRETVGAPAGLLLVHEAGVLAVAGSFGLTSPDEVLLQESSKLLEILDRSSILSPDEIPEKLREALGDHPAWVVTTLRAADTNVGYILSASKTEKVDDADRLFLQQLAQETAVALENVRLFSRVRELSVDEERQRLARELHDGIAQALTHVRLELEFLALHAPQESVRIETGRLARVVEGATKEVRNTITGLRASVSGEGLGGTLRSYLRDLRGLGGPEIVFNVWGSDVSIPPEIEAEIFRIAQEAASNALRHSRASKVTVSLEGAGSSVRLTVEDDGIGIQARAGQDPESTGMGLSAMKERSARIGAHLTIDPVPGGGTRVQLLLDVGRLTAGTEDLEEVKPS